MEIFDYYFIVHNRKKEIKAREACKSLCRSQCATTGYRKGQERNQIWYCLLHFGYRKFLLIDVDCKVSFALFYIHIESLIALLKMIFFLRVCKANLLTVMKVARTIMSCIMMHANPLCLSHSHTMTPFDAPGKQAF